MPHVSFRDTKVALQDNESVLQALDRAGEAIPSSCRSGVCQCCLMQARSGVLPEKSQAGLKDTLKSQGYFLACQCYPAEDLVVALPAADAVPEFAVQVLSKQPLNEEIVSISLSLPAGLACKPGQYLQVLHDGLIRSYSVASLPEQDGCLEIHVRRIPGGVMSNWFHDSCEPGMELVIRGPFGSCFYVPDAIGDFPILLAGTSSGLAPLSGIARDALQQGHSGQIVLIHGALQRSGLYQVAELELLQECNANFTYLQSVMEDADPEKSDIRLLAREMLGHHGAGRARIFLCGAPDLVNDMKVRLFLAGAASTNIHADPFVTSAPGT